MLAPLPPPNNDDLATLALWPSKRVLEIDTFFGLEQWKVIKGMQAQREFSGYMLSALLKTYP